MAYEVTANRKRPKDFDHLVGQEFVVSTLKNSISSGRIAHAYLFAGPRGVGKTSAARILAKALNCPGGPNPEACADWEGADEIARGRSIDVIEIDGASNTSVNDVREIKDEVLFPPQSSRYKIYIIDEVHMLSNSAFNALLKTIEEPPPYVIFIFATTELHKVPATIRSRCQQFIFRLISLEEIKTRLEEAAAEMRVSADAEALYWIAKESTGSMRDAYTLFDQVVSFSSGHVTLESIREKLGLVGMEQMNEIVASCLEGKADRAIELFHGILVSGVSVEQFVIDLCEYYRGILFIHAGISRESLLGYSPERFNAEAVAKYSRAQLERILGILLQCYRDIRYSVDPRYELELTLSRLSRATSFVEPHELYEKFRVLRSELQTSTAMPEVRHGENPAAPKAEGVDDSHRKAIVQVLRKEKLSLSTLLDQVAEWDYQDGELCLGLESRYAADTLEGENELVLKAAREVLPNVSAVRIRALGKPVDSAPVQTRDQTVERVAEIFKGQIVGETKI